MAGRPTLFPGDRGDEVATLQQALVDSGFDPGAVDGDFGPRTEAAVRALQAAVGLDVDGIVGPATWEALLGPDDADPVVDDARTVKVWINAFIPRHVPGKTEDVAGGDGRTMLRGPVPGVSDCFLTDGRDFSSDIDASSRMHSEIEIDLSGPSEVFQWHRCHATVEVDCEDGTEECRQEADTSDMTFRDLRGAPDSLIHIDLRGAANNPCFTGSPDIDYTGTVTIDTRARTVAFAGMIDAFPAFEMYASIDGGPALTLFRTLPIPGKDPWNLAGDAARAQAGQVSY